MVDLIICKHKTFLYDPIKLAKRRKGLVVQSFSIRTEFARHLYALNPRTPMQLY